MATTDSQWDALLDDLHQSPMVLAIVAAGGGSGAIARCFRRAGASRSFVQAVIPYSRAAMTDYLGGPPPAASASLETAQQLAKCARRRAAGLCDAESSSVCSVGIALVAALPTTPPRPVEDRIHVVADRGDRQRCWSLRLTKGDFNRSMAETIGDELVFKSLAWLLGGHSNDSFFHDHHLQLETAD